jgi:hypothetical protein
VSHTGGSPYGLVPFDLQAPARLLVPHSHDRQSSSRSIELGSEGATLEVLEWGSCRATCKAPGSHEAGRRLILRIPCDALPHCNACECGSGHDVYLTSDQETALGGLFR